MRLRARALDHEGRALQNRGIRGLKGRMTTAEVALQMDKVRDQLRSEGFTDEQIGTLNLSYAAVRKIVEPPPP